jgi:hypothetical protein
MFQMPGGIGERELWSPCMEKAFEASLDVTAHDQAEGHLVRTPALSARG